MTKAQYNSELEKTEKLEKIYGEDSDMIKNRLEWLATVDIEDEEEDVDDMDFESLYKEAYKIVAENAATKSLMKRMRLIELFDGLAEWCLTMIAVFGPIILLIKLIF